MTGLRQTAIVALLVVIGACGSGLVAEDADETPVAAESVFAEAADDSAESSDEAVAASEVVAERPATDAGVASEWDSTSALSVDLSGAVGDVEITEPGTFVLTGQLDGSGVVVDVADGAVVLVLDGVDITNDTGPAVLVVAAEDVTVVTADGSENHLEDGPEYETVAELVDQPNAALYSTADLTMSGGGTLVVVGSSNDGIGGKDDVEILGGTVVVTAVDDGIRGKDSVTIADGNVSVVAAGDGIKSDNDTDATKGWVTIAGGSVEVVSGGDSVSAETDVLVTGGSLDLEAGGGASGTTTDSAKGLKGLVNVVIEGGSIVVDAADDAVHSNNNVSVVDGDIQLATGDDGIHADATLSIIGGTIVVTESYEGLESAIIDISGGEISIRSDDDGINVAGGVDGSGDGGRPGRGGDRFAVDSSYRLTISGGTVVIDADGDGLDSNGTATMTGGLVVVHGPTANNNGAIDAGSFDVSGGTLVAVGSSGMAEGLDASSSQSSVEALFGTPVAAGTVIQVLDSDGEVQMTLETWKSVASLVFSSPTVESGASYRILVGGEATGDVVGGLYLSAGPTGGTELGSITAR